MDVIEGYRNLTQQEIAEINAVKHAGKFLGEVVQAMRMRSDYDQRWVSIAETHFQQGLMAATRAIEQPTTF
jgi:hypothetical protein